MINPNLQLYGGDEDRFAKISPHESDKIRSHQRRQASLAPIRLAQPCITNDHWLHVHFVVLDDAMM